MKQKILIETARPFKECIKDIEKNKNMGFQWFAAKGKGGCLFEIGGRRGSLAGTANAVEKILKIFPEE